MQSTSIQEILPFVEKPSRYVGSEINRVVKPDKVVRLRVALAFPDLYEIATSHFGIQILYHVLNAQEAIAAERVFAPGLDMAAQLRRRGIPLCSLESGRPLKAFDLLGFSLLYELNYTNVLYMLELAGIPFDAGERDLRFPLVVAGGPCTVNPEPVAAFFDAMVVGDGEEVALGMAREMVRWKTEGGRDKEALLTRWSRIEGVYVPAFFEAGAGERRKAVRSVRRAILPDLDAAPFPEAPVVPFGRPIHDRLRLEISRGCTRGCRFCQAGMIYRPVRERSPETLLNIFSKSLPATGYEDLSLLSLSTGDYSCIGNLVGDLMARCGKERVAVSLPSLRAGSISPRVLELIKGVRKTGFTIAPEAGSQRLRDVINKNISEADIRQTVEKAFALGWKVIKLYFMIGLPTERDSDVQAIVDLVREMRTASGAARRGQINVSVATFVPKSHTPFQWAAQSGVGEAKAKIEWIKARLKVPGIQFKWQNPLVSRLEGLWARGDRRLGRLLVAAYRKGAVFDGWSDHFDDRVWMEAAGNCGLDIDAFTTRQRALEEPLPWDHVDTGVSREYLAAEWRRALGEELTPDCRNGTCLGCGVCDFERIAPVIHEPSPGKTPPPPAGRPADPPAHPRLEIVYRKGGPARFFGHLELMSIFTRALRRARIPLSFSRGFHPKPKISFEDPLPVGLQSEHEILWITPGAGIDPETAADRLNAQLPEGLSVKSCRVAAKKVKGGRNLKITYKILIKDGIFDPAVVSAFHAGSEWVILRKNARCGETRMDLKRWVHSLELEDRRTLRAVIFSINGKTVRPGELLARLFQWPAARCLEARIVKESVAPAECA